MKGRDICTWCFLLALVKNFRIAISLIDHDFSGVKILFDSTTRQFSGVFFLRLISTSCSYF